MIGNDYLIFATVEKKAWREGMTKMDDKQEPCALEQVRAARRRISEQFDHDPRKLVEHYMALQQQYKDRLVGAEGDKGREQAA